jgi:hypothetical protein
MRLTINLDDDVYRMARAYAAAEDCSLSAAVNRLLRRLMQAAPAAARGEHERFPVSRCREERSITAEEVRRLDIEDETS